MAIGFVIRSSVVVGALYYTRVIGVWGSTQQTEHLYNELKEEISPHVDRLQKQLPFEVPALPQRGEVRFLAKHYYNQGVKETFNFIHMLPCYTGQLMKKAKDTFQEFSKPPKDINEPTKSSKK